MPQIFLGCMALVDCKIKGEIIIWQCINQRDQRYNFMIANFERERTHGAE